MITDRSSAASESQGFTLCRPVKYAPVTYQNCLPHVVYLAMMKSTVSVQAAAIAQARPIHSSESTSACPQSSEGVKGFSWSIGTLSTLGMAMTARERYPATKQQCGAWLTAVGGRTPSGWLGWRR
jgi:hypothetical protein